MQKIDVHHILEKAFEEGYLRAARRSDFEVISETLLRDIRLARRLPKDQQLKLAEMMRDALDQILQR